MKDFNDAIANLLLVGIFISPIITIPIAWKLKKLPKALRIIIGILLALILSAIFYYFFLGLFFKSYGAFE